MGSGVAQMTHLSAYIHGVPIFCGCLLSRFMIFIHVAKILTKEETNP